MNVTTEKHRKTQKNTEKHRKTQKKMTIEEHRKTHVGMATEEHGPSTPILLSAESSSWR
jgi:hypothetical protein